MNTFGRIFRVTLFGESHGPGIGVVVEGCPPGMPLAPSDFEADLARRRPGAPGTTARVEPDAVEILSGVFEGRTTGAPIALLVRNQDVRSGDYPTDRPPRPGHADWPLRVKWSGFQDPRGGGTASGRLTVGLVLAGTLARRMLPGVSFAARLLEAGGRTDIEAAVAEARADGDSVGGLVECTVTGLPPGLGEPWFDAVESLLAHVLFAVPAVKGIEFGSGFQAARMRGSEHNDAFLGPDGRTDTHHAGGVLGGITSGDVLTFRVAVKPAASIARPQRTWDFQRGRMVTLEVQGRHDACIALRVPVVVEAAAAIVLADLAAIRQVQAPFDAARPAVRDGTLPAAEPASPPPGPPPPEAAPTPPSAPSAADAALPSPAGTTVAAPASGNDGGPSMALPKEIEEDIESLRRRIDEINGRLLEALSERGRLVQQMQRLKSRWDIPMHSPGREMAILEDLVARNPGPFSDATIRSLFREILRASLALMEEGQQGGLRVTRRPGQPDRVVPVGAFSIGGAPVVIAGPCSVEGPEQIDLVAFHLKRLGVRFLRGGAYKPRTSPYDFQGLGEEGLRLLHEAGARHGLATVSEVVDTRHVDQAARYVDMLQVGSRNMANFELLKAVAGTGKPILLKRGFAATLDEFLHAAEYLAQAGNEQILLCERGIRSFERETRFTLDISAVPLLRQMTALPVLVDVSHAAGRRDILVPLGRAALAAGAQGVMVEVHPVPHLARSDAQQQLDLREFEAFLKALADLLPERPLPGDPDQGLPLPTPGRSS